MTKLLLDHIHGRVLTSQLASVRVAKPVEVDSLLDVRHHLRWRDHPPGVLLAERTSDGEADGFLRAAFWRFPPYNL